MAEGKKYTGYGTCSFANGEYTGELVDGVRQGYGVFKFSNYDIYDGDWEAGKMHGKEFINSTTLSRTNTQVSMKETSIMECVRERVK